MNRKEAEQFFSEELLKWDLEINTRLMPWKGERDPYRIWLSEVILQQTRVEQGWAYYDRFLTKYPTIADLASAPETEVFKLWEGLGYYSRCRNLIATAKLIATQYQAVFPSDYESILKLKGIGPYTASAIAAFAFDLPHAVVDGNVNRVLSRFFGISISVDSNEGRSYFFNLAHQLLDRRNSARYNQAIMDFGATVCKPRQPLCETCPLSTRCVAYNRNAVNEYPVKSKKPAKKQRWLYYILAEIDGSFMLRKRTGSDIWQNLYEFILIETDGPLSPEEMAKSPKFKEATGGAAKLIHISRVYKQQLTHQTINGFFTHVILKKRVELEGYQQQEKASLKELAFPRFITRYFADRTDFFEPEE